MYVLFPMTFPKEKIAGDFSTSLSNPSLPSHSGDRAYQRHPLFEEYVDVCSDSPGADKPWAVGTECRQTRMQDEGMHGPERYREMLASDAERRLYIIDADVEVQTEDLCFVDPKVAKSAVDYR